MRHRALAPVAVLIAACALSACGSSTGPTAGRAIKVTLRSPAITPGHPIPAVYTCDGKDITPPLEWGAIPANTSELLLVAVGLTPSSLSSSDSVSIEWALAGISPRTHKLNAGEYPTGSHLGLTPHNKRRYNLCPKRGVNQKYQFMLYGVPVPARISPEYAAQPILAALTEAKTKTPATGEGAFLTSYKRH
jgi:phosphatidylethanolamine-binding protein (PEBP) family uncharacterized protein